MIYFVRHGQTDANLRIQTGEVIGEDDVPLNKTGKEQARQVAERLRRTRVDLILTSPYKRAVQTAAIINKHHNIPVVVDVNLRERDGGGVGEKTWHEAFDFDKNVQFAGESATEFFERVYAAIDGIKEKYGDKNIVIVAHGGVHHGFYAYFNNLPWKGNLRIDRLHNGDMREYEFQG